MPGTFAESPASTSVRRRTPATTTARKARGRWRGRPLVLGEGLFRDALIRERKRSDRFDQPFLLVLVAHKSGRVSSLATWSSLIEALTAARRDTDVLGWFERGSVLGLIVPEIDAEDAAFTHELESSLHLALASRLDAEAHSDVALRFCRYVAPTPSAAGGLDETAPIRDASQSLRARTRRLLKRALDICVSAALLAILAPLFGLIAALVKLRSRGPVFFRQARVGQFGQPFTMLKFRTMHVDADHAIHKEFVTQLIKGATPQGGNSDQGTPFKIVNDPRVTAIGRLLRKTSLDEIPQLWNVLLGDMSLVGPRPPLAYEVEQYKPWHYRRVLEAKPGITGLWQVSGRSRTTFDDMVRLDLRYAKNSSAWTDIKILVATPRAVISGKGAC